MPHTLDNAEISIKVIPALLNRSTILGQQIIINKDVISLDIYAQHTAITPMNKIKGFDAQAWLMADNTLVCKNVSEAGKDKMLVVYITGCIGEQSFNAVVGSKMALDHTSTKNLNLNQTGFDDAIVVLLDLESALFANFASHELYNQQSGYTVLADKLQRCVIPCIKEMIIEAGKTALRLHLLSQKYSTNG